MNRGYIYKLMMITMCLLAFSLLCISQKRVNVTLGIGMPELLNIGVRYQANQTQLGLSVGSLPLKDETIISISAETYYHFAGRSQLSTRWPWYVRFGMNYLRNETKTVLDKYLYANLRVGRDFNISEEIGINIDIGLTIEVIWDMTIKEPPGQLFNIDFPILPGLGFCLFYRI